MKRMLLLFIGLLWSFLGLTQIDYPVSCHGEFAEYKVAPGFVPMAPVDTDGVRSDTFDVLHYTIFADLTAPPYLTAHTTVSLEPKMEDVQQVTFDLLDLQVDSVFVNGVASTFINDGFQVYVDIAESFGIGEEFKVDVYYQGNPTRDDSGFGGLVTEQGYIYNLGIGIAANPHNFGRGWFPCFDNFKERSTYEISMKHSATLNAHAVGTEIGIVDNGDGTKTTTYAMEQEITTYQTSIAIANYHTMWSTHNGQYGPVDIKLMAKPEDSTAMKGSMGNLPAAIDCMEDWFGPYVWERVGYVATTVGAMEHPTHIAYPISSINGNAESNNRLMAHELAHNWFGNLITLSTERDMWIKEGPSEYGAHLTTECLYGKEDFLEQVRANHFDVLQNAHRDDEIFRPLSNMPNEFTYGTHTYRKGASVIHNLRGYLGDTLFSVGMRSILENFAYSHLDAHQFRDQLTESTGMDMQPFFDAWVFNPGFSVFVEDSVVSEEIGGGLYETSVYVQQKLYGTDSFHGLTPLTIHLYGYNNEVSEQLVEVSGQYTVLDLETDFEVKRVVFNKDNTLNQARTADEMIITEEGINFFSLVDVNAFEVEALTDDLNIRIEHIYGKPEDHIVAGDLEINENHYWRIIGDFPGDYKINLRFPYDGKSTYGLDYPLATVSEDSILLFYRTDPSQLWEPIAADLKILIPIDGKGSLEVENVQPGEYAIGKGVYDVSSAEIEETINLEVYPNPSSDELFIDFGSSFKGIISFMDLQGRQLFQHVVRNERNVQLNTSTIPAGQYFVEVMNQNNTKKSVHKVIIIK